MQLKDSIITKVTLLFVFSSICFVFFVLYFIAAQKIRDEQVIRERFNSTITIIDNLIIAGENIDSLKDYLRSLNFFEEMSAEIRSQHKNKYFVLRGINSVIATNLQEIDSHFYIALHDTITNETFLFSDYREVPSYTNHYIIALIAFITLVFFYIIVLDSLLPLRSLRKEVLKFSRGDMNIQTIANNNDEIGTLSAEFTRAAKILGDSAKARTLFLRSIMHELKTPITKGFLVIEMLEDSPNNAKVKVRLDSIFKRLNEIINNLAMVEKIDTNNYQVQKSEFSLTNLMQEVNKMLIIEYDRPRKVILENRNAVIMGDFELMSLSVKNLVDNAFKYSSNKKVRIFVENADLVVQNEGAPFKNDINEYFKPFYDDGTNNALRGLGLGMYIIKHTILAQGYEFAHKYEQNCHYFYIKNCIIRNLESKNKSIKKAKNATSATSTK